MSGSDYLREQSRRDFDKDRQEACVRELSHALEQIRSDFQDVWWPQAVADSLTHSDYRLQDIYDIESVVMFLRERHEELREERLGALYARLRELGCEHPEGIEERLLNARINELELNASKMRGQ